MLFYKIVQRMVDALGRHTQFKAPLRTMIDKYSSILPTYDSPLVLCEEEIQVLVDTAIATKMSITLPKRTVFDSIDPSLSEDPMDVDLLVFLLSLGTEQVGQSPQDNMSLVLGQRDARIEEYIIQCAINRTSAVASDAVLDSLQCVLFGLSCNPLTTQHIAFIQHLTRMYPQVLIILNAQSPLKDLKNYLPTEARMMMLQKMKETNGLSRCILCRTEVDRVSPSRMIATLSVLKLLSETNEHYTLALGLDGLLKFTQWYQWQRYAALCSLKFYPRPGYSISPETMHTALQPILAAGIHVSVVFSAEEDLVIYKDVGALLVVEPFNTKEYSSTDAREFYLTGQLGREPGVTEETHQIIRDGNFF